MRFLKRISGLISLLLIMALLVPCAFAEEYDLSAGEIKAAGDGTGTYVAQGSHNTDDDVQGFYYL